MVSVGETEIIPSLIPFELCTFVVLAIDLLIYKLVLFFADVQILGNELETLIFCLQKPPVFRFFDRVISRISTHSRPTNIVLVL